MSDEVEVVVAGAGHNSLIAAAYLTRDGHEAIVMPTDLDRDPSAGRQPALLQEVMARAHRVSAAAT